MVSTYSEAGGDIDASEKATEALIAQIKNVGRKGDGESKTLQNGFSGLVKEILAKTKKELKGETKVIATGGMAKKISSLKVYFNDIIPTLTLDGLLLFSKKNN